MNSLYKTSYHFSSSLKALPTISSLKFKHRQMLRKMIKDTPFYASSSKNFHPSIKVKDHLWNENFFICKFVEKYSPESFPEHYASSNILSFSRVPCIHFYCLILCPQVQCQKLAYHLFFTHILVQSPTWWVWGGEDHFQLLSRLRQWSW